MTTLNNEERDYVISILHAWRFYEEKPLQMALIARLEAERDDPETAFSKAVRWHAEDVW